jgi:CheY-like chemotaxis protein
MATILVVEDDALNRELLERLLYIYGYEVISAPDGAKGVAMARAYKPDLIIMDMGLPILNGWQATHRLKAAPDTCHIPVIALTAYAFTDDRARCLSVGCDDYDVKPLDTQRLMTKLVALLERVRSGDGSPAAGTRPKA